jgi:site-specific DNA-methyltransferase (adenine-specific)
MKPYYEHGGITIYHGDCREILPDVWFGVDLLLTDPPYGINAVTRGRTFGTSNACATNEYIPVHDDDKPFHPQHLLMFPKAILWGGNHYGAHLPSEPCWLAWDKRDGTKSNPMADCELAWTNLGGPARLFSHRWMGMIRESERDKRMHPTQKPVALMRWCLANADLSPNSLVLDAYMGSGPVLVAAKESGHRAIGIEIEERYCEIAAKRLQQEVLPLVANA